MFHICFKVCVSVSHNCIAGKSNSNYWKNLTYSVAYSECCGIWTTGSYVTGSWDKLVRVKWIPHKT